MDQKRSILLIFQVGLLALCLSGNFGFAAKQEKELFSIANNPVKKIVGERRRKILLNRRENKFCIQYPFLNLMIFEKLTRPSTVALISFQEASAMSDSSSDHDDRKKNNSILSHSEHVERYSILTTKQSTMKEFMMIFINNSQTIAKHSPEDWRLIESRWKTWMDSIASKGNLVSPGNRLGFEGKIVKPGKIIVDGPFTESKEIVGGYSIIRADSLDQAVEISTGCPILDFGGTVEVRNVVDM